MDKIKNRSIKSLAKRIVVARPLSLLGITAQSSIPLGLEPQLVVLVGILAHINNITIPYSYYSIWRQRREIGIQRPLAKDVPE